MVGRGYSARANGRVGLAVLRVIARVAAGASQVLVGWCQRSSFPHVWGWPGREQICLIPAERSMRSKSAAPLRARRPVKQLPLSFMTWAGRPHSCTALVKASQVTLAVGPVSTRTATRARE